MLQMQADLAMVSLRVPSRCGAGKGVSSQLDPCTPVLRMTAPQLGQEATGSGGIEALYKMDRSTLRKNWISGSGNKSGSEGRKRDKKVIKRKRKISEKLPSPG